MTNKITLIITLMLSQVLSLGASVALAQEPSGKPRIPPPVPLEPDPVAKGTLAPDGIGISVRDRTRTVGAMTSENMTYTPWEDDGSIEPLAKGAQIPAKALVKSMSGESFDLNAAVASQPTVVIFFRGGWCPYCNAHLRELRTSMPALKEMGYQLLAISPDAPEKLRELEQKADLGYELLSDENAEVAAGFGLRYKLTQQYIDHVKSTPSKTDLSAQNSGLMLTPGAFVLDTSGEIRFTYVNNNYTVRVSQTALLDAAKEALH